MVVKFILRVASYVLAAILGALAFDTLLVVVNADTDGDIERVLKASRTHE